jgi:hypothetical protein
VLVEKVIGAACEVSNVLGPRFLEKVYERALIEELSLRGIRLRAQATFSVAYKVSPSAPIRRIWWWMTACLWSQVCRAVRAVLQRAPGTMHQLSESFRTPPGSAHQLSSPQSGMASYCPQPLIRVHSRLFAVIKTPADIETRSVRRDRLRSSRPAFTDRSTSLSRRLSEHYKGLN